MKIYLDNAATTKLHPKVLEKMIPFLSDEYGNPSSIHSFGRKSRVAIEESREIIANFIGAEPGEIYFTSGGTEANNLVINGIAKTDFNETERNNLVTSAGDHKAVLSTILNLENEGFESTILKLNNDFQIDLKNIESNKLLKTSLVSVVQINNETGIINDLSTIRSKFPGIYLHSDVVQSFGKIRINVNEIDIDALSVSAHKLYGPKGIGFAYIKSGTPMSAMIIGGGQERNRRAGTENTAGIVGLAEAVKIADDNLEANFEYVSKLKEYLWKSLNENGIENLRNNSLNNSSPYILSITFDPEVYSTDSEAILMFLDINGIAASSGSACSSGTLKPSHVIKAAGYSEDYAKGTVRFSFSNQNTFEEMNKTVEVVSKLAKQIRK